MDLASLILLIIFVNLARTVFGQLEASENVSEVSKAQETAANSHFRPDTCYCNFCYVVHKDHQIVPFVLQYFFTNRDCKVLLRKFNISELSCDGDDGFEAASSASETDLRQYCASETLPPKDNLFLALIVTSCLLLLLTISTYLMFPTLLNVHGKAIVGHMIALVCQFGLQLAEHFVVPGMKRGDYRFAAGCWVIGVLMTYFSLAALLWLAAVNFDIWMTFRRDFRTSESSDLTRIRTYAAICWLVPLLWVIILVGLDAGLDMESPFRPAFGTERCFFPQSERYALVLYFFVIVGLLLAVNMFFFVWTNVALCSTVGQSSKARNESKFKQLQSRFLLFFKLFCVMGTAWTINLVLWFINNHEKLRNDKGFDILFWEYFNISHGFCYFVVFACKPSILRKFKIKFFGRGPATSANTESTNHSTATVKSIRASLRHSFVSWRAKV